MNHIYREVAHPYELSTFQKNIVDWLVDGRSRVALASAVPGSGKTSTALAVAKYLYPQDVRFTAFNRSIVGELKERLPHGADCMTLHSMGMNCLRRSGRKLQRDIAKDKVKNKVLKLVMEARKGEEVVAGVRLSEQGRTWLSKDGFELVRLCELVRLNLLNENDEQAVLNLASEHGMTINAGTSECWEFVPRLVEYSNALAEKKGEIDYVDMIYLPTLWQLSSPSAHELTIVDECQDLSPAQLKLVLDNVGRNKRILFVGDPNQAIYGFAGAGVDSVEKIVEATNAEILPLSVCYRCPRSHVELAGMLIPSSGIQPRPNAPEGELIVAEQPDRMAEIVKNGDLVLCRWTAPLIAAAFNLIADGVAAKVRGRDIAKMLGSLLMKIADEPGFTMAEFQEFAEDYASKQAAFFIAKSGDEDDPKATMQYDRVECLCVVYRALGPGATLEAVKDRLDSIFANDNERPPVELSTIHRAKGLEEDSVIWLEFDRTAKAARPWQQKQEMNLRYVAATRSKRRLVCLKAP